MFDIVIIVVDSVFKKAYFIFTYTIVIIKSMIRFFLYYV